MSFVTSQARRRLRLVRGGLIEELDRGLARLSFLAEVSLVLSGALSDKDCFRKLMRLIVPYIADWCTLCLLDDEGRIVRVASTHINPVKARAVAQLQGRYPPDPHAPFGIPYSIRTGRSELIREFKVESRLERYTREAGLIRIVTAIGAHSTITVPLIANEETLGAIWLVTSDSGREFGPDDLRLAEQLAARASMAVWHLRRYRAAQDELDRCRIQSAAREDHITHMRHDTLSILTSARLSAQMMSNRRIDEATRAEFSRRIIASIDRVVQIAESSRKRGTDSRAPEKLPLSG